jgi:hypothetical protein
MRLDPSDIADLRPLITEAVRATLAELQSAEATLGPDRLGYTEREAAALIGVAQHVLRDARLRGELTARRVGSRYVYSRATLLAYLVDTR